MLLNFNTVFDVLSIALFDMENRSMIASFQENSPKGHARLLIPRIQMLLKDAGFTFGAMKEIAVCRGPGSFTGARIGCSTALGLSIAKNIRAMGISSFQMQAAWAFNQIRNQDQESVVVLLKSGLVEWCVQEIGANFMPYDGVFKIPLCLTFDELLNQLREGSHTLTGDGLSSFLEKINTFKDKSFVIQTIPDREPLWAEWIGKVAFQMMDLGIFEDVSPLYVRPSYVKCA